MPISLLNEKPKVREWNRSAAVPGHMLFAMIDGMSPVPTHPASSALGHALLIAGDRWNLQIIRAVFDGAERFSQLRDELGISDAVLSHRLGRLIEDGILDAHP